MRLFTMDELETVRFVGHNIQCVVRWFTDDERLSQYIGKTAKDYIWIDICGDRWVFDDSVTGFVKDGDITMSTSKKDFYPGYNGPVFVMTTDKEVHVYDN